MVAILLGADNGFFYAGQVMHFSSPFTVFLIYHKHCWTISPEISCVIEYSADVNDKADIAYAERIGELAEMSIMIDAPRSFSSDLNTILQLGVTLAPYAISAVSMIIIELIKNKKKIKIKVTDDSIEIEGNEEKALEVVRELLKQKKEDQAQKTLNDLLAGNKLT